MRLKRPSWSRFTATSRPRRPDFFGDALTHQREEIAALVQLYAMIGRMRLVSSENVIDAAQRVLDAIVETYLGPNHTLHEMIGFSRKGGMDSLITFGDACRRDLAAHSSNVR